LRRDNPEGFITLALPFLLALLLPLCSRLLDVVCPAASAA
jgi:hypothetical protein